MLKFIAENKEWLFSGLGITVIVVLCAIIKKLFTKKKSNTQPVVIHVSSSNIPTEGNEANLIPVEKRSLLTCSKINEMIDKALPLQRDDVKNNFKGIKVAWDTYLKSASKHENEVVTLYLAPGPKIDDRLYTISCKVSLNDYRELSVLPEGAKIRIEGEIDQANSYVVDLINVKLSFFE